MSHQVGPGKFSPRNPDGSILFFERFQAQAFHDATMLPGVKRSDRAGSIKSFNAWIETVLLGGCQHQTTT